MTGRDDRFLNFIFQSFGLHLGVFLLLTVKVLIFPAQIPVYQQSVRIDMIALPEKKTEPTAKVQIKKQAGKPPKPKPPKWNKKKSPSKKRLKEEQNSAITRLKALKNIAIQKKPEKREYKGNALSKGSSLIGLEKLHHESYLNQLDRHVRNHWHLPEWLTGVNLSARVLILIDKNGSIVSKTLILKSGNEFFDQNVFKTLEKANPLPPPPANLVNFYSTKGVEFRFPE